MVLDPLRSQVLFAADDYVGSPSADTVDFHIEKIADSVHRQLSAETLARLKEKFFVETGKFFPEDHCYHAKISYFLDCLFFEDWLIFDELSRFNGKIPFHFLDLRSANDIVRPVTATHHSMYIVKKVKPQQLILKDLLHAKREYNIIPRPQESFTALNKNDLIQGFVYETASGFFLSRGVFFHSQRAEGHIKKYCKKWAKGENQIPLDALQQLAKLHIRQLRHAHVDPKQIYAVLTAKPKKGASAFSVG